MNRNRLSTNLTLQNASEKFLEEKIFNLLNEPSNYEFHSNGKI
jgi:hypothetical protein